MNIHDYREFVLKSEKGSLTEYPAAVHAILGMNGEIGECLEAIKKNLFQGFTFSPDEFLKELGDVSWYVILLADKLELDFDKIISNLDGAELETIFDPVESHGLDYVLDMSKQASDLIGVYKNYQRSKVSSTIKGTKYIRYMLYDIREAAKLFDKTLEDIFDINKTKIETRYPNGFNVEDSISRVDVQ